ncbi:uncharacterized mitochondrial protein AtMg00810-like [Rutidosis leptorrhynchoides]|uniref:uncharacterized mitochondrial protein AtMg00810-like n=1 Tax=Rutidosis leptorrhynchoides TaxID=125765 RepID=UPI003A9989A3
MDDIFKPKTLFNLSAITSLSPIPSTPKAALSDPHWNHTMIDEQKFHSDGSLERYKARLVGDGRTQTIGVDCNETFSPVIKLATIRIVLTIAFRDHSNSDHLCLLQCSLYGLKQGPCVWYHRFATFVSTIGFSHSQSDNLLFVYQRSMDTAYILLYVDDIILVTSSSSLRHTIMSLLTKEFAMEDLGNLSYFLGINVTRNSQGLFLDQTKYAHDIITRADLANCNPVKTPVDTNGKLSSTSGKPYSKPTLFRSLGTLTYGLQLHRSSINSLVSYTDADWGGCPDTRRSTSRYCDFLGDNLISWSSTRQPIVSRSSVKAEYRGVTNVGPTV